MSDAATAVAIRLLEQLGAEITSLSDDLAGLQAGKPTERTFESLPSLQVAGTEINQLRYRIKMLERAIAHVPKKAAANSLPNGATPPPAKKDRKDQKAVIPKQAASVKYVVVEDFGDSVLGHLAQLFSKAIEKAFPQAAPFEADVSESKAVPGKVVGDYQCNSAFKLRTIIKEPPQKIGNGIKDALEPSELIRAVDVSPQGFINIHLSTDFLSAHITDLLVKGISPPSLAKRRVLVDFSSPNIAKEMHVGHLRSTIIGDAVCRLLEFVGFDVLRINHVGDWGTQFGMLIAHLQDRFPNYLTETPPISDLQAFYKESKTRFDEDAVFKARAYDCVVKLQNYDDDIVKAWKQICEVSRTNFQKLYDRLDIRIEERGESFYQQRMVDLVKDLEARNVLIEDEGRKVYFPTGCTVPLTVVKSDGGFTYDTSDLAALRQRIDEDAIDWAIYVVDAGQNLHLETVFAAGRDFGFYEPTKKRVMHVGFGLVLGEDKKKFKTRSGDTVKLSDLLDEGVKRADEKLRDKNRDSVLSEEELRAAREAVAYGCIKYADLSHNRTNDYVFSFDRMLDDRGNTAVYLLYAYVRIRSIGRNADVDRVALLDHLKTKKSVELNHPAEIKLSKQILKFSDTVLTVLETLNVHLICEYLYALSTTFTEFYGECQIITKKDGVVADIDYNRLALAEATADTMAACFRILGLRTLERI